MILKYHKKLKSPFGFTLIELLVVISVIALLSALAAVALNSTRVKARDNKRKADIRQLRQALNLYYDDNKLYPTSGGATSPNNGWTNSNDASWDTLQTTLAPYMAKLPIDPKQDTTDWPGAGKYSYVYYSLNYGCDRQWYMLVYKLENPDIPASTMTTCNGQVFNYAPAIIVGERAK